MRIIYNARIWTLDARCPTATALAIEGDRIVAAGNDFTILNLNTRNAELFDAEGSTIIPGLTDAHIHLEQYAFTLQKIDCDTPTRQDCLRLVEQRADMSAPGQWILGHGWNQNNWADGFGTSDELDLAAPNNPVYLTAKSLHAAWANNAALHAAGVSINTPDPSGGRILRDLTGRPSGILLESAMPLVTGVIPQPMPQERLAAIKTAVSKLSSFGLTGIHDFDQRNCFSALQQLHERHELNIRVQKSIPLVDLPHAAALGLRSGFGDLTLRTGGVKVFLDGALGPRTAAMLQPYDSEPDNLGILSIDPEELLEIGRTAVDNGFSLAVHAIGDRATRTALNAFSQLKSHRTQNSTLRHRIEHVQLIDTADIPRLAELGVVASMQPVHAIFDMDMADQFWGNRAANAYAWNSLHAHGTILAFGSDAPVEAPDPFTGLYAAITRCRLDATKGTGGWYSAQCLSAWQALQAYTVGPAYAAGLETQLGRLSPGYLADLLLLDQDPLTCDVSQLKQMRPRATMLGGNWIYQA